MSASRPHHESDDELLSAYVDNELTAAERAAVEERLRIDERARQIVSELRAASEAVQALPRTASPRDFAASVLSQIEHERLAIEPPPVVTLPPADDLTEHRRRRGLIYAAFAVAAALLLMFLRPADQPVGPGQLAQSEPRRRLETDSGAVQTKSEGSQFAEEKEGADANREALSGAAPAEDGETPLAMDRAGRAAPLEQERAQSELADAAPAATTPLPPAPAPVTAAPSAPAGAATPMAGEAGGFGGAAETRRLGGALPGAASGVAPGELDVYDVATAGDAAAAEFEQLLATYGIAIVEEQPPADLPFGYADPLSRPGLPADAARQPTPASSAYLIEATPEQVEALAAALRADDGKLQLAAGKEVVSALGGARADRRTASADFRGGFGGGGRGPGSDGRAWRLSIADRDDLAVRKAADKGATLKEQSAAAGSSRDADVATATPHRALFVLQPEAVAAPAAPAPPATAEPQQ
jgi:hypothetical protein